MARESHGKARRRLILIGIVITLVPMTAAPRDELSAPLELIRLLGPLLRLFLPV